MAKIRYKDPTPKSRRQLILADCYDGDIVKIEHSLYLVLDARETTKVADLLTGETDFFDDTTPCKRYTGELIFCQDEFEEFAE